jgi:uncharacterized protein (TIGR02646 family)
MTQSHCAFCDSDNFATSLKTIEHFRPKDTFPHLAYTWTNLFLCCNACQNAKGEKFEETLLKPDETEYQFSTYFQCNFKTGELEPNAIATDAQKVQASDTIRLYDLNREDLCIFRLKEAKRWKRRGEDEILDDFGYRYFIE